MRRHVNRRTFLKKSALGAAGFVILADPRSATSARASERLNVALVGVGGRGRWFVDTIPKMANVVALCDINERKLAETLKRWEDLAAKFATSKHDWERRAAVEYKRLLAAKPKAFADFRKMLDAMGGGLDAEGDNPLMLDFGNQTFRYLRFLDLVNKAHAKPHAGLGEVIFFTPEPTTFALVAFGLLGLARRRRRRR